MALSEYAYTPMTRIKKVAIGLSILWCFWVSNYARELISGHNKMNGEGETLIVFAAYGLFLWWVSIKKAGGWTAY